MGSIWLPAALGAGIGGGVLLLIVGLRGVTVDPTRPPSRADRAAAAIRSPALAGRILAAAAVGAVTLVLTRWPVAAAGMAALVVLWPKLFGGSNAEQRQIAALEALVTWTESLRDTIAAHAGSGARDPRLDGERAAVDPAQPGAPGRADPGPGADGQGVAEPRRGTGRPVRGPGHRRADLEHQTAG